MRFIIAFLLILIMASPAKADGYLSLGSWKSTVKSAQGVDIHTSNNVLRITVWSASILRVQVGIDNVIVEDSSYAVVHAPDPAVRWDYTESDSALRISTDRGILIVEKYPVRLRFLTPSGAELCADDPAMGHGWDGKEVHCWKTLHDDEKFFGLGEKTGNLDKRGSSWQMWNSDFPAYTHDRDPLYASIPFFITKRDSGSYGLFFDNTYRTVFHMGSGSNRTFSFGAEDGVMNYYVIFGPTIAEVLHWYTGLTGRMPLPPLWSLGYQQSRWNYFPSWELQDLARNFRQRSIPADVLYLDIRYMDKYKVFTWDREAFPNPSSLLSDLKSRGFRVVTIIDPGIKVEPGYQAYDTGISRGLFATYPDGQPYQGMVWPGWCHFPDFTRSETRTWWGDNYAVLRKEGVAGFWNDMNEPAVWGREMPPHVTFEDKGRRSTIKRIHNVYAHMMAAASHEGLRTRFPNERPFLLTRAAFAGTQRYSAIWTGDNVAEFDHMALGIRMCLGLGLSGMPFVGSDVGGFIDSPSPELFARWIQLGAFTPLFRTHSVINTRDQEPWSFGEEVEDNVREYISLRYQLLPTLYSAMRTAARDGIPVMRPLFLLHEHDPKTFDLAWQHQFLFGDDILVAPVLTAKQQYQKVYLPDGAWYDPVTHKVYDGRKEILVDAPWWRLPWFQRAGGCIFRRPTVQYTDQEPLKELILELIGGYEGSSTLYLDDGVSFAYEHNDFDEITVSHTSKPAHWEYILTSSSNRYASGIEVLRFRIHNCPAAPVQVTWDGKEIADTSPTVPSVTYDNTTRICEIVVPMKAGKSAVLALQL